LTIRRVDSNQVLIVAALRARGASVTILSSVGGGCPDLLCGFHERNILFECKNLGGRGDRLTPSEEAWICFERPDYGCFNAEQLAVRKQSSQWMIK
jgi:hypothetical protein